MDLAVRVKEYICGVDIARDFDDYRKRAGDDFYIRANTCMRAVSRVVFDGCLLSGIERVVAGDLKSAALAASVSSSVFLFDLVFKSGKEDVLDYKLNAPFLNALALSEKRKRYSTILPVLRDAGHGGNLYVAQLYRAFCVEGSAESFKAQYPDELEYATSLRMWADEGYYGVRLSRPSIKKLDKVLGRA